MIGQQFGVFFCFSLFVFAFLFTLCLSYLCKKAWFKTSGSLQDSLAFTSTWAGPRGQLEVSCFLLSLVFPSQAHNPTYMHNIICPQEFVGTFQFPMVVLFSIMTFEILSLALVYPKWDHNFR